MIAQPSVVVYGTVALDRLLPAEATQWQEFPGGEALNTAYQLSGWGVDVALVGTAIGTDAEGERLRRLIDATGLSRAHIPDDPHAVTPVCEIRISQDGERHMQGRGFAQAVAPPVPEALLAHKPVVAVDPNLGQNALQTALRAAALGGSVVAMDFAHVPEVAAVATLLQYSPESLRRFGPTQPAKSRAHVEIFTQGDEGGTVTDDTGSWHYSAYPISDIVDTTGAGDAFRAGLCYGLLQGWPLNKTVLFASAAAACHCRRLGGASQVPLEEIDVLLSKKT
ncbi:PfkB family carbohydrate kinase [Armatimonas sp.]|uniref:carbohydrate kinase family protein n=1 Tax=Armatimonas sp. TaxID=1872638 RepID=UPI00286D21D8|nr:PfkB family carbohydrate kinase [Armatimonas sp.]